jgi:PhnB protein
VTPQIVVRDAVRAAGWYERALGAETGDRIPIPDGRFMRIELRFGDSRVLIADELPEFGAVSPLTIGGTYGALTITTEAVEELWERALAEGAPGACAPPGRVLGRAPRADHRSLRAQMGSRPAPRVCPA